MDCPYVQVVPAECRCDPQKEGWSPVSCGPWLDIRSLYVRRYGMNKLQYDDGSRKYVTLGEYLKKKRREAKKKIAAKITK